MINIYIRHLASAASVLLVQEGQPLLYAEKLEDLEPVTLSLEEGTDG